MFFTRKIPVYFIIISTLLSGTAAFYIFRNMFVKPAEETDSSIGSYSCVYNLSRLSGYKFIKPLVATEQGCESERYAPIKSGVAGLIDNFKGQGIISSASVYVRDFKESEWIGYNMGEKFNPGSLFKVPTLMTYLRLSEKDPSLLRKELKFDLPKSMVPNQTFNSRTIQFGQSYTIKDLLRYMIAYSDNNATVLLSRNLNAVEYEKTFTDLGMDKSMNSADCQITARDYSIFIAALYNAGYLDIADSEFALSLLNQCDFKDGLVKELPSSVKVAHKFGEWGNNQVQELHESGLIYINSAPYVITIMTKGTDVTKLPKVISDISKFVYDKMVALN